MPRGGARPGAGRPPGVPNKIRRGGARPGGGRPKGIPNKISRDVKDNILAVFIRLGGTYNMALWAKANQTEFYKLYARLVPVKIQGNFEVKHVVAADAETLAPALERHLLTRTEPPPPEVH